MKFQHRTQALQLFLGLKRKYKIQKYCVDTRGNKAQDFHNKNGKSGSEEI